MAGFLEGDGAIVAQFVKGNDYKMCYYIRLSVQFTQLKKRRVYLESL